jgi:hypothetical protein
VQGRALAAAALSGLLSYAACFVPDHGSEWGAGIAFGLLVLGPTGRDARRFLALAALSIAVYRAAVWLAVRLVMDTPAPAVVACGLAGVLGAAALSAGAGALTGAARERGALLRSLAWGAAGGVLIGLAVDADDESRGQQLLLLAGFVVWQVGYTAAHRLAPWRGPVALPAAADSA